MLVGDVNALAAVNRLNLVEHIRLHFLNAVDLQYLMGIDGTLGQRIAGAYMVAVVDLALCTEWNGLLIGLAWVVTGDDDLGGLTVGTKLNRTADGADDCGALGLTRLEYFLNTGKTLSNILCGCNAAGMECTHGELRTGFADSLRGNDTDRFADRDLSAGGAVHAVALAAYTVFALAGKDCAALNGCYPLFNYSVAEIIGKHGIDACDEFARPR